MAARPRGPRAAAPDRLPVPERRRLLLLVLAVFAGHAASPHVVIADSLRAVYPAASLVQRGDLDLDEYAAVWGTDAFGLQLTDVDRVMTFFPWAPSLFAVPWVALLQLRHVLLGGPAPDDVLLPEADTWLVQVLSMSAVVALACGLLYLVVRDGLADLPPRRRQVAATLTVLVAAFGTSLWSTASRSLWQHGPSVLLLTAALLCAGRAARDPRWLLGLGAALAGAYAMRPTNALPALVLVVWAVVVHRRRVSRVVLGAAPVLLAWGAVNLWGYGHVVQEYYSNATLGRRVDGRDVVFWEALAGTMVSPGRGLLVFTPVLVVLAVAGFALAVSRRQVTSLQLAAGCAAGGHWVAVSLFAHWWGGHSYGPRLLTDITPFLVLLALPAVAALASPRPTGARDRRRRTAALGVVAVLAAWGVVVHAQGAVLRSSWCWNVGPVDVEADPSRVWDVSDPQAVAGLRAVLSGASGLREETRPAALLRTGCGTRGVAEG